MLKATNASGGDGPCGLWLSCEVVSVVEDRQVATLLRGQAADDVRFDFHDRACHLDGWRTERNESDLWTGLSVCVTGVERPKRGAGVDQQQ